MSLLIIGSAAIDSIQSPEGSRERVIGGSGVHAAFAASFFAPVQLVGVVGDDWPDANTDLLRRKGIDTQGLEFRKGAKTLSWSGKYFDNMDDRETLDIQLNVMGEEYKPIVPEDYRETEFVFLANGSPISHLDLLSKMKKRPRLVVADTMNFYIENTHDSLMELLGKIDGLILNDSEVKLLTGMRNYIAAARKILTFGPKFVIVKKGENGAMFLSADAIRLIPAYPTEKVVDPTGAGDSFAGALMGALAADGRADAESIMKALARATIIASYNVEGFSLERLETLTREEIANRLDAFRQIITF